MLAIDRPITDLEETAPTSEGEGCFYQTKGCADAMRLFTSSGFVQLWQGAWKPNLTNLS
jgi:hypothetical protein